MGGYKTIKRLKSKYCMYNSNTKATHWLYLPNGCQYFIGDEFGIFLDKKDIPEYAWPDKPNGEISRDINTIGKLCKLFNSLNIEYRVYKIKKGK